jgi:hypothetical protein
MIVRVTQGDIRRGIQYHVHRCPIAKAVGRLTHKKVAVGFKIRSRVVVCLVGPATYELPSVATRFIDRFDAGKIVSPFTFTATKYTRS